MKKFAWLSIAVSLVVLFSGRALRADAQIPPQARVHIPVCPGAADPDSARCHARVIADGTGRPMATTSPTGYGPAQFQTAYSLPSTTAGAGQTVAIVDAYDAPNAEKD